MAWEPWKEIVDLLPPVATTGLHLKGFRSRNITAEVVLANSPPPPPYTATFSNSFTSTSPQMVRSSNRVRCRWGIGTAGVRKQRFSRSY